MADVDSLQLAYIEETTYGALKTGSNLKKLRFTGESLRQDAQYITSNEIRADRQTADVKRTGLSASGGINLELSYGAYDDLLEAALLSADWAAAVTVTASTISAAASDNSFNDSGSGFGSLVAGEWIKVSGFTGAGVTANNKIFKIVSKTSSKIVVSGGTLVDDAAGESVTIKQGAYIKNGTELRSFNIEKQFTDLSNVFAKLVGMCVDGFTLDVKTGAIITGGFTFVGKSESSAASSSGSGYDNAATAEVLNAVDDITAILEAQAAYDTTAFSLALKNNLRQRLQIGTLGAVSIGKGKVDITGTLHAYFSSSTTFDKWLNATPSSLAVVLDDAAGNYYVIDLPKVKYTSGQRVGGGSNQDIIAELNFTAYRESTENVMIRIVRFPAT